MVFLVRFTYAALVPLVLLWRQGGAVAEFAAVAATELPPQQPSDVPATTTTVGDSPPPAATPRLRLAAFVTNVTPDSEDVSAVSAYLSELAQQHLEVERAVMDAPVQDPMVNSGSVFSFVLMNDGQIIVSDSQETPDAFNGYANKWKGALEYNPDVSAPIVVVISNPENDGDHSSNAAKERQYYIDPTRFETNVVTGDPGENAADGDNTSYTEGLLAADVDSSSASALAAEDLKKTLETRYEVMQVRLVKTAVDDLLAGPVALVSLVENLRNTASTVLAALETRVLLTSLDTKNGVIQFTIHPATDAEVVGTAQKWAAAVASESAAIKDVFGNSIDYSYPAYALTGATTTTPLPGDESGARVKDDAEDNGARSGVVAGAVAGSLCGAGAVGALGFAWRRRQMSKTARVAAAANNPGGHFNDFSPDDLSPHGLTNVDIRGELTPGAAGGGAGVFRG